jgi:methyl-accepting chemotaxis protein
MTVASAKKITYLQRTFYITHSTGLLAGIAFPLLVYPIVGSKSLSIPFVALCLTMGLVAGALVFLYVLTSVKSQLRHQLEILEPIIGELDLPAKTVEALQGSMERAASQFLGVNRNFMSSINDFAPHFRTLSDSSHYLSERAQDGINAAHAVRRDITAMAQKQDEVMLMVQNLTDHAQNEAALSRELSTSLEEMARAMEISTAKFLETSTSVDEMTSSVRETATQTDEIARSVEGTSRDLESIGGSLERIRSGAFSGAQITETVKKDAESGLQVVRTSMEEMERIEQESRRASEAMERLSRQTGEVVKIIEVIKELVSDTELLAFNAAIIAAKAGEEGKGFSVVAEEIRDLADRTTTSAQDIHRIVKAIGGDTREVTEAVEATSRRIARGKELSVSTGEALRKIVQSSSDAATASDEIANLTLTEEKRARTLLDDAGRSLRSVKAIARTMREQQIAAARIQDGVSEMKRAADRIAQGMEEQVRANREFDKGLFEREGQIQAIHEATIFQQSTVQLVFSHFESSEERLRRNAERTQIILREITELETLTVKLRALASPLEDRIAGATELKPSSRHL